jgi:hypothetical protein
MPAAKTPGAKPLEIDYSRYGDNLPSWAREVIETHLAIEQEGAKKAGALGYMARALVLATMPYKDPKTDVFQRQNGDFKLRIVAGYEGGVPFGIYPRLLMSWVTTEMMRTQSAELELGDSLSTFLREVLELKSSSGGARGTGTRVTEQMRRLFGSSITATYGGGMPGAGANGKPRFALKNISIAEDYAEYAGDIDDALWNPQGLEEAGTWRSTLRLNQAFFKECMESPVPIDIRAYKALRTSPMAMDLYTWLTYRMSYASKRQTIRWEPLMMQFGSGYGGGELTGQAVRDFKKAFLNSMQMVLGVYPTLKLEVTETGVALLPGATSVQMVVPARKTRSLTSGAAPASESQSKLFE